MYQVPSNIIDICIHRNDRSPSRCRTAAASPLRPPAWHFQPPSRTDTPSMDGLTSDQHLSSAGAFVDSLLAEMTAFNLPAAGNNLEPPRAQIAHQDRQPQNPLSRLPASELSKVKPLMLTLHCLFPNDLLPALDILDRGLVRRLLRADNPMPTIPDDGDVMASEAQGTLQEPGSDNDQTQPEEDMFLVISASAARPSSTALPSASTTYEPEKAYEVRLHAWNCTCPTFALSAFRSLASGSDSAVQPSPVEMHDRGPVAYPFGGTLTCARDRDSPPVCKHILACVLFARCPGLFGATGDGRCAVSMEELAGWCAGWGG